MAVDGGAIALQIVLSDDNIEVQAKQVGEKAAKAISGASSKSSSAVSAASAKASSAISGVGSVAGKLGGIVAAAFSVAKIVSFGKECLEVGSDLAEVQNVVDVAFGDMSSDIDAWAKTAMTSFGMSETMAKQYAGTFGAMAKSFGYSTSEAVEMSEAVTELAGDVASFYNLDADTAYTKMKSIFTGETESLKDLGVVMTQTALDEYALSNGFGKTTSSMSEQEKVALRLAFVTDKLSDASGDFQRTSGSWANQVKILSLQFDSLKASIGQGLINLFTPVIQMMNAVLTKINEVAAGFGSLTAMIMGVENESGSSGTGAIASDLASASDSANDLTSGLSSAGSAAKKVAGTLAGFDKINVLSSNASSGGGGGGASSALATAVAADAAASQAESAVDKAMSALERLKESFKPVADEFVNGFESTFVGAKWVDDIQSDCDSVRQSLVDIFTDPEVQSAAQECTLAWSHAAGAAAGLVGTIATGAAKTATGAVSQFLETESEPIQTHLVNMFDLSTRKAEATSLMCSSVSDIVEDVVDSGVYEDVGADAMGIMFDVSAMSTEVSTAIDTGLSEGVALGLADNESVFSQFFINVGEFVDGFLEPLREVFDVLNQNIDSSWLADVFSSIGQDAVDILADIVDYLNDAYEALKPVFDFIGKLIALGIGKHLQTLISAFKIVFAAVKSVVKVTSGLTSAFFGLLKGDPTQMFEGLKTALDGVGGFFKDIWDVIKNASNAISDFFIALTGGPEAAGERFLSFKEKITGIGNTFKSVLSAVVGFFSWCGSEISGSFSALWDGICSVWSTVSTWFNDNVITPLVEFFTPIFETISHIFEGLWIVIQAIWIVVSTWFDENVIQPVTEFFRGVWEAVSGFFSSLWDDIVAIWTTVSEWFDLNVIQPVTELFRGVWEAVSGFFSTLWEDIKGIWTSVSTWFDENVIQPVVTFFSNAKDDISEFFSGLWDDICGVWEAASGWFEEHVTGPIADLFEDLKSAVKSTFNGLLSHVESMINSIIDGLNGVIGKMNSFINDCAEIVGKSWSPFGTLNHVSVPRLAQGGYVQANTPQLAIIGDNKTEGEIVAPESKIAEAVAQGILQILPYLNGAASSGASIAGGNCNITLELDGQTIYETVKSYEKNANRRSGGRL